MSNDCNNVLTKFNKNNFLKQKILYNKSIKSLKNLFKFKKKRQKFKLKYLHSFLKKILINFYKNIFYIFLSNLFLTQTKNIKNKNKILNKNLKYNKNLFKSKNIKLIVRIFYKKLKFLKLIKRVIKKLIKQKLLKNLIIKTNHNLISHNGCRLRKSKRI